MQQYFHTQTGREDCHKKYSHHHHYVSHHQHANSRHRVLFRDCYIWTVILLLKFVTSGGKFCYPNSIAIFVVPLFYNSRKKFASAGTLFSYHFSSCCTSDSSSRIYWPEILLGNILYRLTKLLSLVIWGQCRTMRTIIQNLYVLSFNTEKSWVGFFLRFSDKDSFKYNISISGYA